MKQLRAFVFKDLLTNLWCISVEHPLNRTAITAYQPSWAEALQWAYKLLADTDKQLMDEVYAERAGRRALQPHGRAIRKFTPDPFRKATT